ncbi:acyltransferase family protein [Nocardia elegans]|uniref:acyltransferase family protein n=1 Tax=Nocardia elegans TaxID=300029 RepID=UPI001E45E579
MTITPAATRRFLPALEGMRGLAALGVVLTHVAFQTGAGGTPVLGRIWGRFDMAVAVFFALSGFLLWRPHAAAARGLGRAPSTGYYLRHRAARILPAYWVVVCAVLLLLPNAADTAGARVWLSNLALLQVFVPLTLTDGLTQMWSLSVEVAFYLVLPLLAFAVVGLRGESARLRIPAVLSLGVVSLVWNFLPVPTPDAINADNWLPGYLPWFAAGMLLGGDDEDTAAAGTSTTHTLPFPTAGPSTTRELPGLPVPSGLPGLPEMDGLGATMGTITANDGGTLTLSTVAGGTVTVRTDASTQVISLSGVTPGDLPVGDMVMVQGDKGQDGSITAKIIISTALPGGGR